MLLIDYARSRTVRPDEVAALLESAGSSALKQGVRLADLILRPQLTVAMLADTLPDLAERIGELPADRREEIVEGAAAEEVRLRVTRGGVYTLTVSDGHCSSMDSVRLSVLPPLEVDAPDQLNLAGAQEVELSAWTNTEEGEVTWKWKENVQTRPGGRSLSVWTKAA